MPIAAFHRLVPWVVLGFAINAAVSYVVIFRRVTAPEGTRASLAQVSGVVSLVLWMTVIVCGRMTTFYRSEVCRPGDASGFIATCIVR